MLYIKYIKYIKFIYYFKWTIQNLLILTYQMNSTSEI